MVPGDGLEHADNQLRFLQQARDLYNRGTLLLGEGLLGEAEQAFLQCLAVLPDWWEAWYNLGLIQKWQKRWADSLRSNQRAFALQPADAAVCWNLGIAATALRDWRTARAAWRGIGLDLPDLDEPIAGNYGLTPVRLNPDGEHAEVVWCDRLDPVRAVIRNIPLPDSGHRWGDQVLHDGEPKGERVVGEHRYAVFPELERWEASAVPTLQVEVLAPTSQDAEALKDLFEAANLAAEDWTASLRRLCRACSEGQPHDGHAAASGGWSPERDFGLAAPPAIAEALLARWLADAPGRRCGQPAQVT